MHSLAAVTIFVFFAAIAPISAVSIIARNDKEGDSSENELVSLADGMMAQKKDGMTDLYNRDFMRFDNKKRGGARAFAGGSSPYRYNDFSDYLYAMAKRATDEMEKRGGGRAFAPNYWNLGRNFGYVPYKKSDYKSSNVLNNMDYQFM